MSVVTWRGDGAGEIVKVPFTEMSDKFGKAVRHGVGEDRFGRSRRAAGGGGFVHFGRVGH